MRRIALNYAGDYKVFEMVSPQKSPQSHGDMIDVICFEEGSPIVSSRMLRFRPGLAARKMQEKTYESFLSSFPTALRAAVEAAQIRAERAFAAAEQGAGKRRTSEERVKAYIMGVFLAFASAVCKLGSNRQFEIRDIESTCLQFLRLLAAKTYQEKVWHQRGALGKRLLLNSQSFVETLDGLQRTPEWDQYQAEFRAVQDSLLEDLDEAVETVTSEAEDASNIRWIDETSVSCHRPLDPLWAATGGELPETGARHFKDLIKPQLRASRRLRAPLNLARTARLAAEATLRKEAADAVQQSWPVDRFHLEQVLWPPLSTYAEAVFDAIAEAQLQKLGYSTSVRRYERWLRLNCIPAVADDVCRPLGQFYVTLEHVVGIIGEAQWPPKVDQTRRALWGMLTEVLPGRHTENLKARVGTLLNARIGLWESKLDQDIPKVKRRLAAPKEKTKQSTATQADPVKAEREKLLRDYRAAGQKNGIRITDKMIAEAARPTWHDRTPVQRWKRNDPRSDAGDDAAIRRVLKQKPHLK